MAEARRVAAFNAALDALPLSLSTSYDIIIGVGSRRYRATTANGRLRVSIMTAAMDGAASLTLLCDSMTSVRRLSAEGRAAALPLMAAGKLKLTGDTNLIDDLRTELGPHLSQLAPSLRALAFGDEVEPVRWVRDADAYRCMRCTLPFTLTRRRHHCRVCGDVCCSSCAPSAPSGQVRTCSKCDPRLGAVPVAAPPPHLDQPPAAPPAAAADTTPVPLTPADLLIEHFIESSLWKLWLGSVACASGLLLLGAWLLLRAYAAARASFAPEEYEGVWRAVHGLLLILAIAAFVTRRIIVRYLTVLWTVLVVVFNVLCAMAKARGRGEQAQRVAWELAHRINARFVFDRVVNLGGFWVKLAQTASAATALPAIWGKELAKLQDRMPADPPRVVEQILAEELGHDWASKVTLSAGPPLGSATIAQVHRATLRVPEGTGASARVVEVDGVIKVQHAKVRDRLYVDIQASWFLAVFIEMLFKHMLPEARKVGQCPRDARRHRARRSLPARASSARLLSHAPYRTPPAHAPSARPQHRSQHRHQRPSPSAEPSRAPSRAPSPRWYASSPS